MSRSSPCNISQTPFFAFMVNSLAIVNAVFICFLAGLSLHVVVEDTHRSRPRTCCFRCKQIEICCYSDLPVLFGDDLGKVRVISAHGIGQL